MDQSSREVFVQLLRARFVGEKNALKSSEYWHIHLGDVVTLQGTNISHLGKFGKSSTQKCHLFGGYVIVPLRVVKKAKQGISNLTSRRIDEVPKHFGQIFLPLYKSWDDLNQVAIHSWDVVGCFDKCVGIT